MSDKPIEHVAQLKSTKPEKYSDPEKAKWKYGYGLYRFSIPAEDQIKADIYNEGLGISGTYKKRGDSQSDDVGTLPVQSIFEKPSYLGDSSDLYIAIQKFIESIKRTWESEKSLADEETIVAVEEQVDSQDVDTTIDDVSQWTSDKLASAIQHPEAESDMPRLREMILIAEDTDFTVEQSKKLACWLLSFAEKCRDSNDPQDEASVWSAIRTGASMLLPQNANLLFPLLEPGHSIETSLVTVKMVGRIFEAHPPAEVDEYQDLADKVCPAAEIVRNRYAITSIQSAAIAQLAIYALAAMANSKTQQIVESVKQLGVLWFTRRTFHKLSELRNIWSNRSVPVADQPRKLLDRAIQTLE